MACTIYSGSFLVHFWGFLGRSLETSLQCVSENMFVTASLVIEFDFLPISKSMQEADPISTLPSHPHNSLFDVFTEVPKLRMPCQSDLADIVVANLASPSEP